MKRRYIKICGQTDGDFFFFNVRIYKKKTNSENKKKIVLNFQINHLD